MCSIPPAAERAGKWFTKNIADNGDTPELSHSSGRSTSSRDGSVSSSGWVHVPRVGTRASTAGKSTAKAALHAENVAARSCLHNIPNHGHYFIAPDFETLRSLQSMAATSKTRLGQEEAEGVRAAKYREQHEEIERVIAATEKLDERLREAIAEAIGTPLTDLKPGDFEKYDWLLIEKVVNELLITTEDGWDFVDDEIPRMSSKFNFVSL
ncbi:hypothetical protein V8F20_009361 [Naviculisporaceae sp. PSN 640]